MRYHQYITLLGIVTSLSCTAALHVITKHDDVIGRDIFAPPKYTTVPRPCPCADVRLCETIVYKPAREVFTFTVKMTKETWMRFDWTKVTTVIPFSDHDDELLCYAHSKGVRVLLPVFGVPPDQLTNATARTEFVQNTVEIVTFNFLDGVNLDYEYVLPAGRADMKQGLTDLVRELYRTLRPLQPNGLITADYPWKINEGGRFYDYKALTDLMDFMVIMDYDERWTSNYSLANSGYTLSIEGLKSYMTIGITPDKIVMAFPWYGWYYKCKELDESTHHCKGPQRVGEISYDAIIQTYLPMSAGRQWDAVSRSPFLDLKLASGYHQMWYDDPVSLIPKFELAVGLRGVGMWHATALNYSDPRQVKEMWGAVP